MKSLSWNRFLPPRRSRAIEGSVIRHADSNVSGACWCESGRRTSSHGPKSTRRHAFSPSQTASERACDMLRNGLRQSRDSTFRKERCN